MSEIVVNPSQKRALAVATTLAVIAGFYFLKPYLMTVVFAAIAAFVFNPFYKWLRRRDWKPGNAASLTFICSLLAIIIPLTLVVVVSVEQAISLARFISQQHYDANFNDILKNSVDYVNRLMDSLHLPYHLTTNGVIDSITSALKTLGQDLLSNLSSSVTGFFNFFTLAIIYIYVFLSLLTKQDVLLKTVHGLNPLGRRIGNLYVKRMGAMTKAMVRGQFVIATLQGLTDALLLYAAGMHSTFFFFFLILTVLSIIPLGGGIVAIPIGIVMLLTGNIWQGLLIIIGHIVIVTNIDNVLRPRLVPHDARLDPALTLLAVFSGLKFFGFLGIVVGPVLMILIVTTIQVFLDVYRDYDTIDEETGLRKRQQQKQGIRRLWHRKREPANHQD
jgi:predicted PurR-regulated permease PerM